MGLTKRELEEINDTLQFRLAEMGRKLSEQEAENQSLTAQLETLAQRYTQLSEYVERWSAYWNEELGEKVTR